MSKKVLLSLFSLAAIVTLMTGCENKKNEENNNNNNNNNNQQANEPVVEEKKLVCTLTEDDDEDVTENIKYTIYYKGDTYEKVTLESTQIYKSGKYDEEAATEMADQCNADLKKAKGVSCNVQKTGARIIGTYIFTLANLDEEGKKLSEEAGIDEFDNKKYDDLKELLTSAAFKCD